MIIGYLVAGEHIEQNKLFADKVNYLLVLRADNSQWGETVSDSSLQGLVAKLSDKKLFEALRLVTDTLPPTFSIKKYNRLRFVTDTEEQEFNKYCEQKGINREEQDDCDPDEQD
jgi:hypothetical protein